MALEPLDKITLHQISKYLATTNRLAEVARRMGWTPQETRGFGQASEAAHRLADDIHRKHG